MKLSLFVFAALISAAYIMHGQQIPVPNPMPSMNCFQCHAYDDWGVWASLDSGKIPHGGASGQ